MKYTIPYNNTKIMVKRCVTTAGTPTVLCRPEFQLVWVANNIPLQWHDFRNTIFCIYYLLFSCSSWNNIHNWIFLLLFSLFFSPLHWGFIRERTVLYKADCEYVCVRMGSWKKEWLYLMGCIWTNTAYCCGKKKMCSKLIKHSGSL